MSINEKLKNFVGKGKKYYPSNQPTKVFCCLQHDLIIAEPNAHGFSFSVAILIESYLSS